MMYAIRIPKLRDRYIKWCDDRWYETEPDCRFRYTKEAALNTITQMYDHYIYSIVLVGEDGSEELYTYKNGGNTVETVKERTMPTEENNTQSVETAVEEKPKRKMVWKIRRG